MTTQSMEPVAGVAAPPHPQIKSELLSQRVRSAMFFLVPMLVAGLALTLVGMIAAVLLS